MTDPIYPGDIVTVRTNDPAVAGSGFKNAAGALADPTTVTLKWGYASSATAQATSVTTWLYGTDSQVVKDGTGVYHADIPVTRAGIHRFRWVGTGAVAAASEGSFIAVTEFPT